jgi:WD repeat-containing protein 35
MFCCLFKKVTVHNSAKLSKISSNKNSNFLGIGGSEGFVKVVQIDLTKKAPDGGNANPLTFTQNLVCHKKKINVICWNDVHDKLSTSDEEGVIVVWKFTEKGQWETEMINNRELSLVTDLKWSKQGTFLCFVYDDGHAIVGTVEGSRCWGNDIRDKLYLLEWSPDSSSLLFACQNSNIVIFSCSGYQIGEMEIEPMLRNVRIASMCWWTNPFSEGQSSTLDKHLMIAFHNGMILLFDDYQDTKPIKIITEFTQIIQAEWNPSGDIIAVAGFVMENAERKDGVHFYSAEGNLLKVLKIPNTVITSFCWDSIGTKLAITTESIILFALVKQKYKWTYFSDTLVYSFMQESE